MFEYFLNLLKFDHGCKMQIFRNPGQFIQLDSVIDCQISFGILTLICILTTILIG